MLSLRIFISQDLKLCILKTLEGFILMLKITLELLVEYAIAFLCYVFSIVIYTCVLYILSILVIRLALSYHDRIVFAKSQILSRSITKSCLAFVVIYYEHTLDSKVLSIIFTSVFSYFIIWGLVSVKDFLNECPKRGRAVRKLNPDLYDILEPIFSIIKPFLDNCVIICELYTHNRIMTILRYLINVPKRRSGQRTPFDYLFYFHLDVLISYICCFLCRMILGALLNFASRNIDFLGKNSMKFCKHLN